MRFPIECDFLTSSTKCLVTLPDLRFCKNGELSLGVSDPPTKRETTSVPLLPVLREPFEACDFSGEGGE